VNAFASLARRVRRPGRAAALAIAAPLAAPTFTPTARELRKTAPIHVLGGHPVPRARKEQLSAYANAGERETPGLPHRAPGVLNVIRHRPPYDNLTLLRVIDGIAAIPVEAPDPDLPRGSRFTRDARKPRSGGLPVFRSVGRDIGWAGLNEEHPAATLPPGDWGIAGQERDLLHVIAAGAKTARIEVGGTWEALARQAAAERGWRGTRAATGLGYPGGAS
jgi:hypothetical protein